MSCRVYPYIYGAMVQDRLDSRERKIVHAAQDFSGQFSPAYIMPKLPDDDRDTVEPILRDLHDRGYLKQGDDGDDWYYAPDSQALVGFRVVG